MRVGMYLERECVCVSVCVCVCVFVVFACLWCACLTHVSVDNET